MGATGEQIGPARSRERFLGGEPVTGGVRSPIMNSWLRCQSLGLSPDQTELPYRDDFDPDSRLVRAAAPVLDQLASRFSGSPMNVALADAGGTVLERRFGEPDLARTLPPIQSVPGFVFAERVAGTNGIGLALAERRLVQVYGAEHFAQRSQSSACSATPIRDQLSGDIVGVLCFGYPHSYQDPALAALVRRAAETVERRLMEQRSARERALLRTYLDAGHLAHGGADTGNGHLIALAELGDSGFGRGDQLILKEKATELICSTQRAAVEVALPHGRGVTLMSRPVTSRSGVEGVVVEAVLTGEASEAPRAGPAHHAAGPAPADHVTGPTRGLVLVGEPEVGKYAVAARRRLELLAEASARIGTTLDVTRTARELAEMAVPRLADYVTIDVPEAVLRGEESAHPATELHRAVVHGVRDDCPFYPAGRRVELRAGTPHMRCLDSGQEVLEPDLSTAVGWIDQEPEHARRILDRGVHSLVCVPLLARGVLLGIASFYRSRDPAPFGDDDSRLARELAARAALCIDNARRYTREHTLALALQRSLLPHGMPEQGAVEVAHRYLPSESGVGGDWFDVIPLSGARVALLVGDVVGHGLHAAATMGRLRTAARNFAELELAPDELLTHLDNLLVRLDREEGGENDAGSTGIVGATCLYAVYDPTSRLCTMARAGHPPPALVHPDGGVVFPELPGGPPLGLGGLPFETAEIRLTEGSTLVLYTDGLIEGRHRDLDVTLDRLSRALAHRGRTPEDTCRAVIDAVAPDHPEDDIALLVARTRTLPADRVASWDVPADPAEVSGVRAAATRRLTDWGLEEQAFAAELMLSELVTNAVRYGTEPIQVRLILDRTLICEVSDGSSTAPHLRRAASTEEGGRGLFLVAQLAHAWGTRYTPHGKVIWAECALDTA
ncbi:MULTISPECIES: SpoIIE family protein phosphatase [Streptomyces]|uniref:SpoIIE family protein phosphatase n=1 Tax=Streptomyces TaxID=1883 RepID=UPI00017E86C0|nr:MULTISPECIES: SpoIIE family protein phosphatase [Streptomyces]AKL64811.1 protein phosphatase [Streptomyces sp. Mg1]EDX26702.1 magnesium or manganese-dependent protein phosphatase [Streptomyces sp. Mg1]WBY18715.1 SpoIIE family protein phosphatase [Streptomyces goshikiensis]